VAFLYLGGLLLQLSSSISGYFRGLGKTFSNPLRPAAAYLSKVAPAAVQSLTCSQTPRCIQRYKGIPFFHLIEAFLEFGIAAAYHKKV